MIQDQINIKCSLERLKTKCFACKSVSHTVYNCNLIHFCPDKEKVIKSNEFSYNQERTQYTRKKKTKKKRGYFKAFSNEKNISQTKSINFEGGDEYCDTFSSDENIDDENQKTENSINNNFVSEKSLTYESMPSQNLGGNSKMEKINLNSSTHSFERNKSKLSKMSPQNQKLRISVNYEDISQNIKDLKNSEKEQFSLSPVSKKEKPRC